jgi:hypothetical protein
MPGVGWLLGVGNPKTPNLLLGAPVEVTLAIIAYDHFEYEQRITLWVDPVMKRHQGSSRRIYRAGLYGNEQAQNPGSPNFRNIQQTPGAKPRR